VGLVAGQDVELCDDDAAFAGYAYLPDVMSDVLDEFDDSDDGEGQDLDDDGPPSLPRRSTRLN
jgi:hypothetical protein